MNLSLRALTSTDLVPLSEELWLYIQSLLGIFRRLQRKSMCSVGKYLIKKQTNKKAAQAAIYKEFRTLSEEPFTKYDMGVWVLLDFTEAIDVLFS